MRNNSSIKKLTCGVFASITDLLLWTVYLTGASIGKTGSKGVYEAFREANNTFDNFNHRTISSLWHHITKKQLVTYQRRNNLFNPIITEYGKSRLNESLPIYHKNRPWDNKIYLITYDIPETSHAKRDLMRRYLKDLDCRKLQESVWLNPYNIRELLDKFVYQNNIPGMIIISDIGKDGGIGNTSIQYLLVTLYDLEKLNDRYAEYIHKVKEQTQPDNLLLFQYLSILKDDPQLPFELLPKDFRGQKAYDLYQKIVNKYRQISIRPLRY